MDIDILRQSVKINKVFMLELKSCMQTKLMEGSHPSTQVSHLVIETKKVQPKHFYVGRTFSGFWISADAKQRAKDFNFLKRSNKSKVTFYEYCYMLGYVTFKEMLSFKGLEVSNG